MKIGLFIKNLKPEIGGGSTFESEIFQSLLKHGANSDHNFIVLSWQQGIKFAHDHIQFVPLRGCYAERSLKERISHYLLKKTNRIFNSKNTMIELQTKKLLIEKFIIKNRIEMMWYLDSSIPDELIIDIPFITTVWDLNHREQPYFPEYSSQGRWDKREQSCGVILKRASTIITGTQAGKAEIERFYQVAPKNIKVIPFPTPNFALNAPENQDKEVLIKYKIPENYLFYPAQFWPHKNHVGLLRALQFLQDKYNLALPLVLVGTDKGNQQHIKKVVADLNLSSQVHFLGFVPQKDLVSLYHHAFALTFVSLSGPDNFPPIEAFALGCPVIASILSGTHEQLGDAALLVDGTDEQEIAAAIYNLHNSAELRQTLVQKGLKRASQWTGQDYIKTIFSLLDDLGRIRRCWSSEEPFRQR